MSHLINSSLVEEVQLGFPYLNLRFNRVGQLAR
jgi:hypothetical protein